MSDVMFEPLGERVHVDRKVCVHIIGGRSIIAKTYANADAKGIFASMSALWHSPFGIGRTPPGMPEPLGVEGDVITMSFADGDPLGARGSLGSTLVNLPEVGSLLADLHGSGVEVPRRRGPVRLLRSLDRKAERIDQDLREAYVAAIQALRAISPDHEDLVINHGDFSPRNVLGHESGLVLIDFDRLQMSGRGRDLAYFGAWIWVTELMNDPSRAPGWDPADHLLAHYARASSVRPEDLWPSAVFYRGAALLRIAESWSALAAQPDLCRRIIDTVPLLVGDTP